MSEKSIEAYDIPQRVAHYDRDMDVMHPLRHKMFDIALEVLPISREAEFMAIELGMGTGTFSQRILERAEVKDARFRDRAATARFLDELETQEADQPLTLADELRVVRQAGLREVEVFWKEYREVVYGGPRN